MDTSSQRKILRVSPACEISQLAREITAALVGDGPTLGFGEVSSEFAPSNAAVAIGTSGTTGASKEIFLTSTALISSARASRASAIFSKTLMFMVVYGLIVIALGLIFETEIFVSLGADETLFPVMSEYYRIIFPFLFFQFIVIQIYFFIRLDGFPNLAATGLAIGAVVNISLDYLFIAIYGWGLAGAALATGLSEVISLAVMLAYFFQPQRKMRKQKI